jgi:seryl-tRNA synthetase
VHEKVAAFNSLAYQGKQLERKTNDAALKRAMLGREEAESEMRRYREEVKSLRRQIEEGSERERRVGERLENVMVSIPSGAKRY